MTGYIFLILTALFEALGIAFLNKSNGIGNIANLIIGILFFNTGMLTFSFSLKYVEMTIENTIWGGLNILFVAIVGFFYFHERFTLIQYIFIALIVFSLLGLNMSGFKK